MKIILARPRGFCAGVNMAIQSLESALERFGPPLFVYHEIVHNTWVVKHFEQLGVTFVDSLDDVPPRSVLLYSAHGVSPAIRHEAAERQLTTIDATCPLVMKVHKEAVRFAKQGFAIVLIGHQGHDEVAGVMGEAPGSIFLVGSEEDVGRLAIDGTFCGVAYLMQTTLSVSESRRIVERLRERYPEIKGPASDDICYATQNRQQAVRELARDAQLILVVGSSSSSNSRRLAEIAREHGGHAYLIDGPNDLRDEWFDRPDQGQAGGQETVETVLVTAGASAPESVVQQCVQLLIERYRAEVEIRGLEEQPVRFLLPEPLR